MLYFICSGRYLSCEVSVFHHLVPKTFEQHLRVLLIFLGTFSVQTLIGECDISNHQSHTTVDGFFSPRVNLKKNWRGREFIKIESLVIS